MAEIPALAMKVSGKMTELAMVDYRRAIINGIVWIYNFIKNSNVDPLYY
jgi:hypothetical protein